MEGSQGGHPLHWACQQPSVSATALQSLLEAKAEVNSLNDNDQTALHLLCENPSVRVHLLECLVHHKADLHFLGHTRHNALHLICNNSAMSAELIGYLAENGVCVNVNDQDEYLDPPFFSAFRNEAISMEVIKCLLQYKADLEIRQLGLESALFDLLANKSVTLEMVKYMVEDRGMDLLDAGFENQCFFSAFKSPRLTIALLKYIVEERGVGLEERYWGTALHTLCFHNENAEEKLELMKALVELKCDPTSTSKFPLQRSALLCLGLSKCVSVAMIEYLLELKCQISEVDQEGKNFLHLFCRNNTDTQLVRYLVEEMGMEIGETDSCYRAPLHHAALNEDNNCLGVFRYLLEKKAGVNQLDVEKSSPLLLACESHPSPEKLKLLLENKADANHVGLCGASAVQSMLFDRFSSISSLKLLVDHGCDVNFQNPRQSTALHYAIGVSNEAVLVLMCAGASFDVENDSLITPRMELKERNLIKLVERCEKGTLWSPKLHHFFPSQFSEAVECFVLGLRRLCDNVIKQRFPKPLLWMIIQRWAHLFIQSRISKPKN